ncbi:protein of unknown function DUF87 [Ferroglobus placidus DSM 10642]|uniref:AAA+ ATPase domain-containing protein n=1 Tax=Ferroglobus placidus (strain DSM 10642 / AEDII12DO) TaxID=589924 RepID=D3RZ25_FERPA|nr:ATP-binding protein [Ferroglobus placidus]ADC65738.1 protein of unknown function DUF87 [Ferroglobus placidus DSM 10642]
MKAIGLVKGPAEAPHEFTFVTPDSSKIKSGEFVYYLLGEKKVICRVVKRSPVRLYPTLYLSNPEIEPERILRILGVENPEFELYEVKAVIMGYFDEKLGFVNPRIQPKAGQKIYLAEREVLENSLFRKKVGEVGSVHIGYLLNREEDIPVVLDAALLTSEHMCILASTGSGKSYLAGVLAEELLKPYNSAALLIFDPHGEYHTLKEIEGLKEFSSGSYKVRVRIYDKDEIKIRLSELEYEELVNLLPELTDKQEALLNRVYRDLEGKYFTSAELIEKIYDVAGESDKLTAKALEWRITRYVKNFEIIDDNRHIELKELLKPGQASVLQLTELGDREQETLVSVLLKRILNARINAEKGLKGEKLEYPVFVIIEEAHRFASKEARSYKVLRTILSEGRKFGVGVCLISQRPAKIDSDILSQCMTQVVMRIINPADQEYIRKSVESIGKDMIEELPGLTKGQALVSGVALNAPVLIRVRERLTSHGGVSKDAPKEWIEWTKNYREERGIRKVERVKLFWDEA